MIFRNKNLFIFIKCLSAIVVFQSCDRISDNNISRIIVPNECIVGLTLVETSISSDDYYPRGNFIKIPLNYNDVWENESLFKLDSRLKGKELIMFENNKPEHYLLFDSLSFGNYKINYISVLEDTIIKTLDFKYNIELSIPKSVNRYYKEKNASQLNEIINWKANDTLQIYNTNIGCFGGSLILYEFYKDENDKILFRKKIKTGGDYNEPNDEWIYHNKDVSIKLEEFIKYIKEKNEIVQIPCASGNIEYIARLKSRKEIFYLKDHTCGKKIYLSNITK